MASVPVVVGGVSRSGRVRKKSAKLIEMEESPVVTPGGEKAPGVVRASAGKSATPKNHHVVSTPLSEITPKKQQPLKIKLSLSGTPTALAVVESEQSLEDLHEPFEDDNEDEEEVIDAILPPIRIKLNASKGTVELNDRKYDKNESAANKLFKQITGELAPPPEPAKKKAKKSKAIVAAIGDTVENVNFDGENHNEDSFMITDAEESVAAAVEKAKSVKNPKTPKTSIEKREAKKTANRPSAKSGNSKPEGAGDGVPAKEKKKRGTFVTAYTLWSRESRPRLQKSSPGLDFASVSKRLGEIWQALPKNEKLSWKKRAQKLTGKGSQAGIISTGAPQPVGFATPSTSVGPRGGTTRRLPDKQHLSVMPSSINLDGGIENFSSRLMLSPNEELRPIGTSALDVAAHLKILGESLSIVGQRLTEHNGQIAVSGTLSLLMDSTLCALAPLLCLTQLNAYTDGCPSHVHKQTMDNIAYIMPGI